MAAEQNIIGFVCILLKWVYAFFTTIYIVNLLIAQMTTEYETIRAESILHRKFRRVGLIVEYKDSRSIFPPPLNLIEFIMRHCIIRPLRKWMTPKYDATRRHKAERGFSEVSAT